MKTDILNKLPKWSAIAIAGVLVFSSCNQEEREQLRAEAAELEQKLQERDSAFNSIMNVMAEVENEIEKIKEEENLISTNSSNDFTNGSKNEIAGDISRINGLIDQANSKIADLSEKLDASNFQLKAFKNKIASLQKDLNERAMSIASLKEELALKNQQITELNTEVESLVTRVQLQTEAITMQNQELIDKENNLNTAYFAVDTEKKLKEEGLVTKEGGFLWIGRTTELEADATQDKFTEVDIKNTKRFYIDSDKMELVTEHPSDSYKLVTDEDKVKYLEVTDPQEFWKISKYLVISIKS